MDNYYKKQVAIAREFGVSEGTVTNWIKGAEEGRNNLQLLEVSGKNKIVRNEHNRVEMINLASIGKKFRPEDAAVTLTVNNELYEVMSQNNLFSMINSLTVKHEISLKYMYLGRGAKMWGKFFESLNNFGIYGKSSREYLWSVVLNYLSIKLDQFEEVNIIDLGAGNFEPVRYWVEYFYNQRKLGKYLPIDISKDLLEITVEGFKKDYSESLLAGHNSGDDVDYSIMVADLDKDSIEKNVNSIRNFDGRKKVLNLFLFLGGTIGNVEDQVRTLQNIKDAMSPDDYLIIDNFADNIINRTIFPVAESDIYNDNVLYIPDLLGLGEEYFEKEYRYNDTSSCREYNLVMKENVILSFDKLGVEVNLPKNTRINVWKHMRDTFEYIFDKTGKAGLSLESVIRHPSDPEVIYVSKTR